MDIRYFYGCGGEMVLWGDEEMCKGFRKDDAGQMHTIEAVLAVMLMIAALYIVVVLTPADITPGQDFAEIQLKNYGRDVLTLLSYRDAEIVVGLLEYELYREHSPGDWAHDVNVTDIIEVEGSNWTTSYLYIAHDTANEGLTTKFKLWDTRDNTWKNPADIDGNLYVVEYYGIDGGAVSDSATDHFTFRHEDPDEHTNYTINMVWFEDDAGGVSTPVLVWVDKKPNDRDGHFNITDPELTGEQELLQYVVIGKGGTIETMLKEGVEAYGGIWDELELRGWPYVDERYSIPEEIGVIVPMTAFTMELIDKHTLVLEFLPVARGGYMIWAVESDDEEIHSHPIFVIVGKPGLAPGEVISPLEAAIGGALDLNELNNILRSYIPENVGYNLAFSNSTGEIAHMRIINGIPAPGAVTVTVPVFATVGGVSEVHMARLILWYK